jgi:hypothetical protein
MKISRALMIVLPLTAILMTGCGQADTAQDTATTGLKPTPQLSQAQVQAAWEKKHPGDTAPQ